MKILVLGSGGREHALVTAFARSPQKPQVFCSPGNAGIHAEADALEVSPHGAVAHGDLIEAARRERIDLTIVGPEAPLAAGIVDDFESADLRIFGPDAQAAQLEGSKCFTKEFLARHDIPTAAFEIFEDAPAAYAYIEKRGTPIVVKADGLAAGKGVVVAQDMDAACQAVDSMLVEGDFGDAGRRVVIEDCLRGSEISLFAICDGTDYVLLETAQDYKPIFDGDRGPNTGGMGTYSPYYAVHDPIVVEARRRIIEPTLAGMQKEGHPFRGILYAGLMLTPSGPQVIEFNVRFGDPEAQVILPRLLSDPLELFERAAVGELAGYEPRWDPRHSVCVIAASGGYPGSYAKGRKITGLEAIKDPLVKVYHAGTARDHDGDLITSGGRVLGVTALGDDRQAARARAYAAMAHIQFDGVQYRRDIASGER